ncbi:MAG: hypothetical protein B9S36_02590 [Verrucomicrobiia bacterium Tous-C2TDCM]|nr:MAG: hypothetical protein B9S36_02590 [Verrucomicrobiae bacterium Tous-C2TDCM]
MTALFAAVWSIYLGDRLFDAWRASTDSRGLVAAELPERHAWARRQRGILTACLVAAVSSGAATIGFLETSTWRAGLVVAAATGLYFLLFRWSFSSRVRLRGFPTKEIAIAGCFTAGAAVAAAADSIADLPLFVLAGLGCLILGNCLLISRSEAVFDQFEDPAAFFAISARVSRLPEIVLFAGIAFGIGGWWRSGPEPALFALILCSVLTLLLAGRRSPDSKAHTQPVADGLHLLTWVIALPF